MSGVLLPTLAIFSPQKLGLPCRPRAQYNASLCIYSIANVNIVLQISSSSDVRTRTDLQDDGPGLEEAVNSFLQGMTRTSGQLHFSMFA